MSKIKSMIATDTTTWVDFPDIAGFEVNIRYVTREDLLKIRSASLTFKFNKRTRQREEEVNNDKFLELYSEQAIISWRGLKIKHLPMLMPVDISSMNPEEEIQYSAEEALELLRNSGIFDSFISDAMADFEQFSKLKRETTVKN
jgi:hypothetical protein